jgi:hypothetical protein
MCVTTLLVTAAGLAVRAQDEDEPDDEPAAAVQGFALQDWFNRYVFGNYGNPDAARKGLERALHIKIEDTHRAYGLSDAQRKKLQLAGRGDLKRLGEVLEKARKECETSGGNIVVLRSMVPKLRSLRDSINAGPFGDGSLFAKTLKTTLTAEQAATYETLARRTHYTEYERWVYVMVAIEGGPMKLRPEQESGFAKLLLEETQPAANADRSDSYTMLLLAASVPEAKLKPLFDDEQWQHLQQRFRQARKIEAVRQATRETNHARGFNGR